MTGFTGSAGYAVISLDDAWLFTDFRYATQALSQVTTFQVMEYGPSNAFELIATTLRDHRIHRMGFEQNHITYGAFHNSYANFFGPHFELVPTEGIIEKLRRIKDPEEITLIKKAVQLADEAFEHILTVVKPGLTEKAVALELEMHMRQRGATQVSFETIVASGPRSALPHGVASDRLICNDEFVKFDFGALFQHYCSDMTRTIMMGKPTEQHRQIYNIVREAQAHVLSHLRPGMTGREGDALARKVIEKYGYGEHFGHGTGHSLGMEIHENPRLSLTEESILEPGIVITVEPGIYLPGFGGVRIEDIVVITESGCEILTRSSKDFMSI
jgi:Xaa-Pro aminopeptidase